MHHNLGSTDNREREVTIVNQLLYKTPRGTSLWLQL